MRKRCGRHNFQVSIGSRPHAFTAYDEDHMKGSVYAVIERGQYPRYTPRY